MVDFPNNRNFLDEFAFDLGWMRQRGLWLSVTNAERGGLVREGNLLDWHFTQFPAVCGDNYFNITDQKYLVD